LINLNLLTFYLFTDFLILFQVILSVIHPFFNEKGAFAPFLCFPNIVNGCKRITELHPDELAGLIIIFCKNNGGGCCPALELDLGFELFHGGDFANVELRVGNFVSGIHVECVSVYGFKF
jgi:hypothetical protein